jgi:enamine deaminase RidA (YjgF/YER057c/UK114 family)
VYGNLFEENGYPAATGIGMKQGGIIIEFIAVQSNDLISIPIDNPSQIAAHIYSKTVLAGEECVLKTTPKFERARYLEMMGKKLIFISGTASIIGEKTVGVGDPTEQTEVTINNIKQLYSTEILDKLSIETLNPKYGHARVYVKNRKDFPAIKKTFKSHFGNLPVVYIIADICRNDLLVEIEGKVILE